MLQIDFLSLIIKYTNSNDHIKLQKFLIEQDITTPLSKMTYVK
jgi:hypothetical protein